MTEQRLGEIFAPVDEDLGACKELLATVLLNQGGEESEPAETRWADLAQLQESLPPPVTEMALQLREMEGKWIRATVVLLGERVFGSRTREGIQVATALELIHLATLIHDDIIDDADLRRGQRTISRTHGDSLAVLMGDLLFARAMQLLVEIDNTPLLRAVSRCVAEVCLGEISEHHFSWEHPPTEGDYMQIIYRKTASLMECCARAGCLVATEDEERAGEFAQYGLNLGMAFQIADDILDISGDGHTLGKDSGADLRNGNLTLPMIHLAAHREDESWRDLVMAGESGNGRLLQLMMEAGSLEYARSVAEEFRQRAEQVLEPLARKRPDSEELKSLTSLARLVVERTY
jgi:octaprenyl-diphosphate synthase